MTERRKDKRFPAQVVLKISSFFNLETVSVTSINPKLSVINISKGGIGFTTDSVLPIGFYYNACLSFPNNDTRMYCVIKTIRRLDAKDGGNTYGCEMVGLAPTIQHFIEECEKSTTEQTGS